MRFAQMCSVVAGLVAFGWVTYGSPAKDVKEFLYLQRWKGYWGQVDSCIGFYSAYALKKGIPASFAEVQEKCQASVNDELFYLGYPDWRWESSINLGGRDPLGSVR